MPLIRIGKYWNENDIIENVPKYQENINLLLGNLKEQEDKIKELDNKFKENNQLYFPNQTETI